MRNVAILAGCSLLMAGCAQTQRLSSQEVLKHSAQAVHDVQSVRFETTGTFDSVDLEGRKTDVQFIAQGWTQRQKNQVQLHLSLNGPMQGIPLTLAADVILAGENDAYVNVQTLSNSNSSAPLASPALSALLNQWWHLPSSTGSTTSMTQITPDPRILELQTAALNVKTDHGIVEWNGRPHYHYDVMIAQDTLMRYLHEVADEHKQAFDETAWQKTFANVDMSGETWIDAETYQLSRLHWNITSKDTANPWTLIFDIRFTDYNKAPNIAPPPGAKDIPALTDVLPSAFTTQTMSGSSTSLSPQAQQQLLQQLLQTH